MAIVAGSIIDHFGFKNLEILFMICLFISLMATIGLFVLDRVQHGTLNMTPAQRQALLNDGLVPHWK